MDFGHVLFLFGMLVIRNIFKMLFKYTKQKFLLLKRKGGRDKVMYRGRYLPYYISKESLP